MCVIQKGLTGLAPKLQKVLNGMRYSFGLIHVLLLDENDNPPRFLRDQYEMQVVDNWPTGIVVERLTAVDSDVGKNARVTYSLAPGSTKYFSINPANGELSVSGELAGAARDQPYELTIVAEDSGNPSLSTSIKAKVRINEPLLEKEGEKGQVHFINPPVEFVLKLKEDLSNSLQHFDIDESSGEVYVSKPLDYEQRKFFTILSVVTVAVVEPGSALYQ
ncbi:unnamed protein product [Nippostrongylus brasiliensis]|uniref:CA domain-containing protein n=1 Tax=Nippostrongylus brasiliensis TaxID=27835 RepID=A0A0N4Y6A4_NIPBR|nr:unnamed protein product [Nippostrongylus brasiliensis]